MNKIWIYILAIILSIVTACSDDIAKAHEESSSSGDIIIIIKITSSSETVSSSFSRSNNTQIHFSNLIEISSSSKSKSSSSKAKKYSSSSKPASSSAISSSAGFSSTAASSSSNEPKSSATLRFYDCDQFNCITMDYLSPDASYGEFLDKRDNQVYRTIVISNHVWTAQNMNFEIKTDSVASKCYDNELENCEKYGRLYTWDAAKKVCPEGWHLPTAEEWMELLDDHSCNKELLDDSSWVFDCTGNKLKSSKTWNESTEKENSHGFSATAAGINFENVSIAIGEATFFWSSTDTLTLYAYAAFLQSKNDSAFFGAIEKENGFSVRCVKGEAE